MGTSTIFQHYNINNNTTRWILYFIYHKIDVVFVYDIICVWYYYSLFLISPKLPKEAKSESDYKCLKHWFLKDMNKE